MGEQYKYDKYGKLRKSIDAEKINQSICVCSSCGGYVWQNGNSKPLNYKQVIHRECN